MAMQINKALPLPAELKQEYPLPASLAKRKEERDREIRAVFTGESDKFVVVVGPCSADNETSVCEYVSPAGEGKRSGIRKAGADPADLHPISRVRPGRATKGCCTSRNRTRNPIFWAGLLPSAKCISAPLPKAG